MVNGLYLYSAFLVFSSLVLMTTQSFIVQFYCYSSIHTHTFSSTFSMRGGFSILPKDTSACRGGRLIIILKNNLNRAAVSQSFLGVCPAFATCVYFFTRSKTNPYAVWNKVFTTGDTFVHRGTKINENEKFLVRTFDPKHANLRCVFDVFSN